MAPAPAPSAVAPAAGDLSALWSRLVEAVGRASPFTRTYLLEAHPVSFKGTLFTIGFDPEFEDHISLVDNARNQSLLQTKLAELGHAGAQIKFIKAERPEGWSVPAAPISSEVADEPARSPVQAATATPAEKPASAPASKQAGFSKEDFKNDPLIKKALEIFRGQIVDIRT